MLDGSPEHPHGGQKSLAQAGARRGPEVHKALTSLDLQHEAAGHSTGQTRVTAPSLLCD